MNLKIDYWVPIFLFVSSITFLILYITVSNHSYICIIRMIAICLAMVSTGVVLPPVRTVRRQTLKAIMYILFIVYFISYTITTFVYIFDSTDPLVYIDLLMGCINIPLFFFLATRVKGYEEESVSILDYPTITVEPPQYYYEVS